MNQDLELRLIVGDLWGGYNPFEEDSLRNLLSFPVDVPPAKKIDMEEAGKIIIKLYESDSFQSRLQNGVVLFDGLTEITLNKAISTATGEARIVGDNVCVLSRGHDKRLYIKYLDDFINSSGSICISDKGFSAKAYDIYRSHWDEVIGNHVVAGLGIEFEERHWFRSRECETLEIQPDSVKTRALYLPRISNVQKFRLFWAYVTQALGLKFVQTTPLCYFINSEGFGGATTIHYSDRPSVHSYVATDKRTGIQLLPSTTGFDVTITFPKHIHERDIRDLANDSGCRHIELEYSEPSHGLFGIPGRGPPPWPIGAKFNFRDENVYAIAPFLTNLLRGYQTEYGFKGY